MVMATLYCRAGDPDYLKVVLLRELLEIRESPYSTSEGENFVFLNFSKRSWDLKLK